MHTAGYIGSVVMLSKRFVVRDKAIVGGDQVVSRGRGRQQGGRGQGRAGRGGGVGGGAGGRPQGGRAVAVEADRFDHQAPVIRITLMTMGAPWPLTTCGL